MNTLLRFAALLLLGLIGFYACKQNTASTPVPTPPVVVAPQPAPTISSVKPDTGMAGMEITITGANLKGVQEVKFGSLTALVTSSETGKLVVTCPDFESVQPVPVSVRTSSGTADGQSFTGAPALVIDKKSCIPAGMIPNAFITLKGKNFGKVTQVNFSNTTVVSNQFTFNDHNGIITLKVPAITQSGKIWMVNEYGSSQGVQFDLLTAGDGLNTSNIATSVGNIATGSISDQCNPSSFFYCISGSVQGKVYGFKRYLRKPALIKKPGEPDQDFFPQCTNYDGFAIEIIADREYEVYNTQYIFDNSASTISVFEYKLKLERKSQDADDIVKVIYTGNVIIEKNGQTYMGSMISPNNDIYAYSIKDGSPLRMCRQPGFFVDQKAVSCTDCK